MSAQFDKYGVKVNYDKVIWFTEAVTFLGHEIKDGKWSFESYLSEKMDQVGPVNSIKKLESVVGILSYARRCVKYLERILGPLRAALSEWKAGPVTEGWKKDLQVKVREAFRNALDNLHWLVLPGVEAEDFVFELETDWATGHSGYMLFARRGGEERLVDIGSKKHGQVTSSYLGELDAIKWACEKTKAFRGSAQLLIRTDSQSVCSKAKDGTFYDSDLRAYKRWAWLAANEPGFRLQFTPGSENTGADMLSRPVGAVFTVRMTPGAQGRKVCDLNSVPLSVGDSREIPPNSLLTTPFTVTFEEDPLAECLESLQSPYSVAMTTPADETSLEDEIRMEHSVHHWGPFKTYHAMRRDGFNVTWAMVRKVCQQCAVCALFRPLFPKRRLGQPPYSLIPGHTVYADLVGPLPDVHRDTVEKPFCYIQSIVDSATRLYGATPLQSTDSAGALVGLDLWIQEHGEISVLVTDNGPTYRSKEVDDWCEEHGVQHVYIAPYSHQSLGLVEKMNRTVVDRLRKFVLARGRDWVSHLEPAVESINSAVHHTTGHTAHDLWRGTELMRREAHEASIKKREARNKSLRIFPKQYAVGDLVWGYNHGRDKIRRNKLVPRWLGPLRILEEKDGHLWRTEMMARPGKPGRKPIMVFHENFMMPYP